MSLRKHVNHDHFCNNCGKRIGDSEEYYTSDGTGKDYCIDCVNKPEWNWNETKKEED